MSAELFGTHSAKVWRHLTTEQVDFERPVVTLPASFLRD